MNAGVSVVYKSESLTALICTDNTDPLLTSAAGGGWCGGSVKSVVPSRERRADAYVALRVLSGMRYPVSLIDHILRRKEIMVESPVYQEILKEGKVMGLREGKVLGLQEGKVLGLQEGQIRGLALGQETRLREDVLEALEVRFGMVPYEVEEQVRRLRGQKTLEGLLRKAILVESLEAFGETLSSVH